MVSNVVLIWRNSITIYLYSNRREDMKVKLINKPEFKFTDWAIGECYDKGCYADEDKMHNRINRVANVSKHSSVLEFTDAIFEIEASTKVLLEMTRHRMASYACKSSRYTLDKGEVVFEQTGDEEIDILLRFWKGHIQDQIAKGKKNDVVSLMLPQVYQYRWVAKFNYRSLQNFFKLRRDKHAHFQIREVADEMYKLIPDSHKFVFDGDSND
jgi:thymidylate synthase (FAD)